jgi:hypothetical protein
MVPQSWLEDVRERLEDSALFDRVPERDWIGQRRHAPPIRRSGWRKSEFTKSSELEA